MLAFTQSRHDAIQVNSARPRNQTAALPDSACGLSDLAAEFVFDMNLNDLVKRLVRLEAKVKRTTDVKIARPTGYNGQYQLIRFALNAGNSIASGNAPKRLNLLADGNRDAGHAKIAARADLITINGGGTDQEAHA